MSALFAILNSATSMDSFSRTIGRIASDWSYGFTMAGASCTIQPQVTLFAFGARRSFLISLVVVLGISFLIWGFWPGKMTMPWESHAEIRYVNDIAIGLYGLPLALLLLWFSRGDLDMLMAAGIFATPYLLPYNLLPLVPAIARLSPLSAGMAFVLSWLPLSANWLGPTGWWLGWVFVIWLWCQLAWARYFRKVNT